MNKKLMNIIVIVIVTIIIIIAIINYVIYFQNNQRNNMFMISTCYKNTCYDNLEKCIDQFSYIYKDTKNEQLIERKTYKCILNPGDRDKLLKLNNIFVTSVMDGTYCDVVFTTYYDDVDLFYLKNRIYNLNMPLPKCIRIRKYYFNPKMYFEIKYPGGTKIRASIDENYQLLEPEKIEPEYKEIIPNMIEKIKNNKIKPLFNNTYKRLSFIYKNNPSIRMTIDTNIEFFYKNIYNLMDKDILEMKIPLNISIDQVYQYITEINNLAGTNLKFTDFSKFEYYYYKVLQKQQ